MTYLVTGATGFIGRFLVPELLARGDEVHVLVRAGSEAKLAARAAKWPGGERVRSVPGDLGAPGLGIDPSWLDRYRGRIEHMFHLAAIYDMTASEADNERLNNGGTRQAVAVANTLVVGHLHHTSSVAAAGEYEGVFTEEMFDEGQRLPSPYHRTKFESERIVRQEATVPWRVYRPSMVVGDTRTGEMDKIDGPYYLFRLLRMLGQLPRLVPVTVPKLGRTNVVPVDFVARAMAHIAHAEGLDRRAFHLVDPQMREVVDVLNLFAAEAGAPNLVEVMPKRTLDLMLRVPGVGRLLPQLGIPPEIIEHTEFTCTFDCAWTTAALAGSGIAVPELAEYAPALWRYWEEHLADRAG